MPIVAAEKSFPCPCGQRSTKSYGLLRYLQCQSSAGQVILAGKVIEWICEARPIRTQLETMLIGARQGGQKMYLRGPDFMRYRLAYDEVAHFIQALLDGQATFEDRDGVIKPPKATAVS